MSGSINLFFVPVRFGAKKQSHCYQKRERLIMSEKVGRRERFSSFNSVITFVRRLFASTATAAAAAAAV